MAYIILNAHGDPIERQELASPPTIGPPATGDLSVHCRIPSRRPKANIGLAVGLSLGVGIATALVLLSGWVVRG